MSHESLLVEGAWHANQEAQAKHKLALEMLRPFYKIQPTLSRHEGRWCFLHGVSIHNGVYGLGNTPEEASVDFDIQWLNQWGLN